MPATRAVGVGRFVIVKLYHRHVLAPAIEHMCGSPAVMGLRAELVPRARGRVLELGMGSGLNLAFYDPGQVQQVVAVDPQPEMTRLAARRMRDAPVPVRLLSVTGEDVPEDARSFDTVVVTFTLCSIADVHRALREVRRLLRPGGQLLFAEHGLAPDARLQRWQERINPLWKPLAGGCHLTRDPCTLIEHAGFRLLDGVRSEHAMPGPKIATWVSRGAAVLR